MNTPETMPVRYRLVKKNSEMKIAKWWHSADVGQLNQYFLTFLLYLCVESLVCLTATLQWEIPNNSVLFKEKKCPFLCDTWFHGYD